jgi:hypothetical protein
VDLGETSTFTEQRRITHAPSECSGPTLNGQPNAIL